MQKNIPTFAPANKKWWCHSSVGRAKDWKSLCPRFDSWWHHKETPKCLVIKCFGVFLFTVNREVTYKVTYELCDWMLINALKLLWLNAIKRMLLILNPIKGWIKSASLIVVTTFPSASCIIMIQNHQAFPPIPFSPFSIILWFPKHQMTRWHFDIIELLSFPREVELHNPLNKGFSWPWLL